jgi:hypothetical protein
MGRKEGKEKKIRRRKEERIEQKRNTLGERK